MKRGLAWAAVGIAIAASGCRRGGGDAKPGAGAGAASASASGAAAGSGSGGAPAAIFSAPIAGARVPGGDVIAVGLVVSEKAIVAARVDAAGRAAWTRVIVPGAAWSADAELHAWPIRAGAAITWRGLEGGKTTHVRAVVAPDGRVVEAATPVGSLVCATDDGLAWSEPADAGSASRVVLRTWGSDVRVAEGPPIDADFALACGARRAYAIAEGDEGSDTRVLAIGDAAPLVALRPGAMGADEERDLLAWATGDAMGLVRLSNGGALGAIEAKGGVAAPLRAEGARVPPEDDVVAVDADDHAVTLVTTHDESDTCPEAAGRESVLAVRLPRAGGPTTRASTTKLASTKCGEDLGPFWTESLGGAQIVAWAERAARPDKKSAPIAGFAWRAFDDAGRTGHVAKPADAMADAGCDDARCYVVALARPAGADGMSPEAVEVIAYP
jgi:hypothetical protein